MLVEFLETRRMSEDGFSVRRFMKGEQYDVADMAAGAAINNGWAKKVADTSIADDIDNLSDRIEYQHFLGNRDNPNISFKEWKATRMRPVATNPATTGAA